MPCHCQVQGERKSEHTSYVPQVPVDAVDGRVMLPLLFFRRLRRDNGEEVRGAGLCVSIHGTAVNPFQVPDVQGYCIPT